MEKKKVGFNLPSVISDAMDETAERVSGKEKWVVVTAAMVLFLRQTKETQNKLITAVKSADSPGNSFASLLKPSGMRVAAKLDDDANGG